MHKLYFYIAFSVILTLVIWIGSKVYFADWFSDNYKYISKTVALSATILFCWSFILSARFKSIEKISGGLDNVYKAHKYLGIIGFCLILLHPIFLLFHKLPDFFAFIVGLGFQDNFSWYLAGHNFGILALILVAGLTFLTGYNKLPYHIWKKTHEWFGLFLVLIIIHIVLVDADIASYPVLKIWMYGWLFFAVLSFFWIRFLYPIFGPKYSYEVESIEYIEGHIYEIWFAPLTKNLFFRPSQYLFLQILNPKIGPELHPFSIACAPNAEGRIKLGIKALGDYTKKLKYLQAGDQVNLWGPYGQFSEKFLFGQKDCVFVGAGIGITPFLGMWDAALHWDTQESLLNLPKSKFHKNLSPKVHLFYLAKNELEASFNNDICHIEIRSRFSGYKNHKERGHSYELYLSDDKGFFTIEYLNSIIPDLSNKFFFLCGPEKMTRSFIRQLKAAGVKNKQIITEDFNFRSLEWKLPNFLKNVFQKK